MTKQLKEIKTFNVRMPRSLWTFLRNHSTDNDKSLNSIIIELVEKYKIKLEKRAEKKLTQS